MYDIRKTDLLLTAVYFEETVKNQWLSKSFIYKNSLNIEFNKPNLKSKTTIIVGDNFNVVRFDH